jgi:hypothetical protein
LYDKMHIIKITKTLNQIKKSLISISLGTK